MMCGPGVVSAAAHPVLRVGVRSGRSGTVHGQGTRWLGAGFFATTRARWGRGGVLVAGVVSVRGSPVGDCDFRFYGYRGFDASLGG